MWKQVSVPLISDRVDVEYGIFSILNLLQFFETLC